MPRPVIGFVGGLSEWVDIEPAGASWRGRKPSATFVLVGPVGTDVSAVQALPNVQSARPAALRRPAELAGGAWMSR